ncbi:MAG TPA: hypothetical protein VFH56_14235 [Acidimicrobiales bacterium]|nr:hypothetical protein [Acidimicrobiales bacterium]
MSRPLTDDQVFEIRERYAAGGITQRELAIEYGVTRPHVGNLIHGRKRFILGSKE